MNRLELVVQLEEHWTSKPKVAGSISIVVKLIFQLARLVTWSSIITLTTFAFASTKFLLCDIGQYYILQVRQMSGVLIRRLFSSTVDLYESLGEDLKQSLKQELLLGIQEEPSVTVKWKICDAVSEIARCLLGTTLYTIIYVH